MKVEAGRVAYHVGPRRRLVLLRRMLRHSRAVVGCGGGWHTTTGAAAHLAAHTGATPHPFYLLSLRWKPCDLLGGVL